ncbi:MAG: RNA methyltransferase [Candidatus Krumholzibacteria bacterium]|nr:RNA methyltransferase [Candidatus Krumholzibacteria bacterium]
MRRIESAHNRVFKELSRLLTSSGIKKEGRALVAGSKPVGEALRRFPSRCRAWISAGEDAPPPSEAPAHLEWLCLASALHRALDVFGTGAPLLLIESPPILPWSTAQGFPDGCSLLVPFQDPENVGAVVRSALAFGAAQVILLAESAHPYHPRAMRASSGAVLYAPLRAGPSIAELPADLPVVPLSAEGRPLSAFVFPLSFGLLAGLEGPGLPAAWRERAVSIPIRSEVESLNAAVAASVALYAWSRARGGVR